MVSHLYWVEWSPPTWKCNSCSEKTTLFGNWVFVAVTVKIRSYWIWVGPNSMTDVNIRSCEDTEKHGTENRVNTAKLSASKAWFFY